MLVAVLPPLRLRHLWRPRLWLRLWLRQKGMLGDARILWVHPPSYFDRSVGDGCAIRVVRIPERGNRKFARIRVGYFLRYVAPVPASPITQPRSREGIRLCSRNRRAENPRDCHVANYPDDNQDATEEAPRQGQANRCMPWRENIGKPCAESRMHVLLRAGVSPSSTPPRFARTT